MFKSRYGDVFTGDENWQAIEGPGGLTYEWDVKSTYVQNPPYFDGMEASAEAGHRHRRRAHPRPVPRFDHHRPHLARRLDQARQPRPAVPDRARRRRRRLQPYGARRGNHEVMMRGTFANIRIKNQMVPGIEGGVTLHYPSGERHDDLRRRHALQAEGVPLVIFAGKEYGTGSSRDWAAKGTLLLGVRAVIAESFERIHIYGLVPPFRRGERAPPPAQGGGGRPKLRPLAAEAEKKVEGRLCRARGRSAPFAKGRDRYGRRTRLFPQWRNSPALCAAATLPSARAA